MAFSERFIFQNCIGRSRHNWSTGVISKESAVLITAAQWHFAEGIVGKAGRPILGDPGQEPNVYVTNIGPHGEPEGEAGGVEFLLHVESETPIDVVITVTVFEPVGSLTVFGSTLS
ncbi:MULTISPECIES: hypothetical protein [unclassified Nonomuraea]|uniref:hypothetical protein n=1 Tax=unclassified Nonomuraea TaxID=2593643 RepID=UPI0033D23D5A